MKKLWSLLTCVAVMFAFSMPVMAVEAKEEIGTRSAYIDYELSELLDKGSVAPYSSASKEATAGTVDARLFNYLTGNVEGTSATFKFTGVPAGAVITNIQAWNPSKSNISQGKFTTIENIQVLRNGAPSGYFKFWVLTAPTSINPCNTSVFNGLPVDATYAIMIQGRVISNETGMDGFTVRATKVRVTYTY